MIPRTTADTTSPRRRLNAAAAGYLYFSLEDCLDTLRHPDLQAAVDGLLDRLLAHAGRKLDDDVALLLLEVTLPPARPGHDAVLAPGQDAVLDCRPLAVAGTGAASRR